MAKFGRFEFGKNKPAETYEGDYMVLERGYVRIFEGQPAVLLPDMNPPRLVTAIYLDKGQSVREIKTEAMSPAKPNPTKVTKLVTPVGRKFR